MSLGRYEPAVEDFSAIITLHPDNIQSLRHRATLYRCLGRPDQAVRDYDEIISLGPDDTSVRQQRQAALEQAEAEGG